jgi:tetratricopeptide (TPR) repeat protein
MNLVLAVLLLQSLLLPPRSAMQNPALVSPLPQKAKKDYDKLWTRFLTGKDDAKLVKDLNNFLKKQKDPPAAITIEAYLDLYKGDESAAASKFLKTVSLNPKDTIALYYLAEMAFTGQDYAGANDFYSRLLALDNARTDVETKRQKSFLLATDKFLHEAAQAEQENRFAVAEQAYRRALEMAPREPSLNKRFADLLAKEKKWEEALMLYRTQLEIAGRNSNTERNIAEALMNLGRTEEARDVLEHLRNEGTLDADLESRVNELEDLGRWGNDIGVFQTLKSADTLTREQLAAIMVRYFPQVAEFQQTPEIITDTQDSWARSEIQVSVGTGLLDLFPNHTFQPSEPITRGLMALSMSRLMRLLGVTPVAAPDIPLPDVSSGDALFGDIQLVVSSDFISLEDSGSFDMSGRVSGEEAVRAIERLLRLSHRQDGLR